MTRNVWKVLIWSNPGDLYEYPEDMSKFENPTFKTKPFLKEDGALKANAGIYIYKSIIKLVYLKYTKILIERAISDVQGVQDQQRRRSPSFSEMGIVSFLLIPTSCLKSVCCCMEH